MSHMIQRLTVGVLVAVLSALGSVFWFLYNEPPHHCLKEENVRWCFIHEAQAIAAIEGAQKAYSYVHDVIKKYSDYKTEHLALHYVGMKAYDEAGSVDKAFTLIYGEDQMADDSIYYSGFQHGLFERYFEVNGAQTPTVLGNETCHTYASSESLDEFTSTRTRVLAAECYHAIGHAIMFISDNNVEASLSACDAFPHQWEQRWCYHGVFMENYYLHIPEYHLGVARPDAEGLSVVELCMRVGEKYRGECSYFVGWVYMQMHPNDFAGAFSECAMFPQSDARICIARVGRFFVAASSAGDLSGMIATCEKAHPFLRECLYGTAIGLNQGVGLFEYVNKGKGLCDVLEDDMHADCENALTRSHESLARKVITEL
ncbi:MAG: Uncharacterized protein G01um10148_348 [Parcubacteria group bacterium Gr01-1014_8]|nr:MAG: Uncharacterized protein G01um10148_348 [Parcubacteria group bacterium Gr01-1014_8]